MGALFKKYKTKFRYALKPLFAMLVARQQSMERKQWVEMVTKSSNAVRNNPAEYLGDDLPESDLLRDVLDEIFLEFMKERAFHVATAERKIRGVIFKKNFE